MRAYLSRRRIRIAEQTQIKVSLPEITVSIPPKLIRTALRAWAATTTLLLVIAVAAVVAVI